MKILTVLILLITAVSCIQPTPIWNYEAKDMLNRSIKLKYHDLSDIYIENPFKEGDTVVFYKETGYIIGHSDPQVEYREMKKAVITKIKSAKYVILP